MTTDSLSFQPTESLVLSAKRRFFPFKIPNFHQQLRNYISTADPDRIYVVAQKLVYSIHISTQKRETIAVIPFEPKCLAAGYGWVAVGGSEKGECVFIRLPDHSAGTHGSNPAAQPADIDSALPIGFEPSARTLSPRVGDEGQRPARDSRRRQVPDMQYHSFGGSIVNSVTIHRLPGGDKDLSHEDVAILSNNDQTVTVYSLARSKVIKVLHHPACMNYAIISPDSSLLAAVGDEAGAYFYEISRDLESIVTTDAGDKLCGWNWNLVRCVEMDIGTRPDDRCCFTIAFSHLSHLCAIGSQSGVITIFDVSAICDITREPHGKNTIVCHFNSSRSCCNGGAVRCIAFAPEPWDLLVWLEDKGRAGIADVRQAFIRRQIIHLDMNESGTQEVFTEPIIDDSDSDLEMEGAQREMSDSIEGLPNDLGGESIGNLLLSETFLQNLIERERLIVEHLDTARWTSRPDENRTERRARAYPQTATGPRQQAQGFTEGANRASRPTSPLRSGETPGDLSRDENPVIAEINERRQDARRLTTGIAAYNQAGTSSRPLETDTSNLDPQPSITLSWTASPSELYSASSGNPSHAADTSSRDPDSSGTDISSANRSGGTTARPSAHFDYSSTADELLSRYRAHDNSSSGHRRFERRGDAAEIRHDSPGLRAYLEAERARRRNLGNLQRQIDHQLLSHVNRRDTRHLDHLMASDQNRHPRWVRNVLNGLQDRSVGTRHRDQEPGGTAGIGWGADGRTLYIATVDGIFEFLVNMADRRTFPVFTYR
ncbi:uncharacterized protein BO97DRAFT_92691 [Aspergillus homomorphus CBS 101889]|uniref:DUF2415 domain-containing protein n=1 Tax=Aspergillus homomorphus (strain CBS 101889) TaxID=1450537 RepID=A0A395HW76_ASPHC|nr:hypothetical protein BO97DRAFT_92691 [Aspergillus homomorphus CBS 101889]RAL11673.1 hypothetical protein BO97DRAFT_92691 [Aspergillus homomorphus CBS 101889]